MKTKLILVVLCVFVLIVLALEKLNSEARAGFGASLIRHTSNRYKNLLGKYPETPMELREVDGELRDTFLITPTLTSNVYVFRHPRKGLVYLDDYFSYKYLSPTNPPVIEHLRREEHFIFSR